MRENLDNGDTQARKAFLQSVISQIEVDDHKVRIIGDKATLATVIAGRQTGQGQVRELLTPRFVGLVLEQRSSLVRLAAQGSHGTAPGPG